MSGQRSPAAPVLASGPSRVLLVRLRSIGDAVLMTPLATAIRMGRPGARVTVALEPGIAPLLDGHPDVDEVLRIDRGLAGRARAVAAIRRRRFDVALDLHGGPTANLLTWLSGAPMRIGLRSFRRPWAYNVRLPAPFKGGDRRVTMHTVESNLEIARSLGLDPPGSLAPTLTETPAGRAEADRALARSGLDLGRPLALLHPGAALASKTWPLARFLEVGRALRGDGLAVALVHSPGGPAPSGDDFTWLGPLSLAGLCGLLSRARLLVANDSGPAHIAAARGVPTVAVFGSQDPRVWRPWGSRHRAIWRGLDCSPCAGTACHNPLRHACLEQITTGEVLTAARSVYPRD